MTVSAKQGHTKLPYVTGVAGAVFIAFSAVLVRLSGASPSTAALFRCLYALPFLAILSARERLKFGPRTIRERRLALIAGGFFAVDLVVWHHAIEAVGAGLATVLANVQVVVVALVAWWLLKERPEKQIAVAVPLVLVGLVLISGVIGAGAYGEDPVLGVVLGVVTSLAYTGFLLVLREGNRDLRKPAGPLFDATAAALVGTAILGAATNDLDLDISLTAHGWLALLAVESQVIGWLLISVSLPRLQAAVTSVILMIQPVGSIVLGGALLGESPSGVQLAGVAVVLAGVLIASSSRGSPGTIRNARAP